jgi:hypothetical protein
MRKTWLRRLLWLFLIVLVLGVLAWLALPGLLKSQIQSRGSEALGRSITLEAVEFKPWTLELTLSGLRIASADGKSTQLTVARVYVDASIQSLWRMAPVLDAVTVEQPHVSVTHLGSGHYDFDDLLQRFIPAPDAAPSPPARYALYNLVLKDGSADFVDHVAGTARQHSLRKLNVSVPFVSSLETLRDVTVQPQLAFELNGSAFDSAAQATPFAQIRKGEATLQITHLDVAPYLPYLPASLPVRLKAAVLDSSLKVSFEQASINKLRVSGAFKVSGIQVQDKAGGELLSIGSVQAVIKALLPLEQSLALESLEVNAPRGVITRKRDGMLSLPGASVSDQPAGRAANPALPQSSQPLAAKPQASSGWQMALERFHLQGGQLRFSDESVAPVVRLALAETQLTLKNVHWPLTRSVAVEAAAKLLAPDVKGAKPASIQLSGEGTDQAGAVKVKLSDLGLALAAPYLSNYLLPQANGTLEGELSASWKGRDLQLQAKRLALHDFALKPPAGKTEITQKELPAFKLLEASDVAVNLQKHTVTLGSLALRNPTLRVARGDDGQWMFGRWLPAAALASDTPSAKVDTHPKTSAKAPPWSLSLGDTQLVDGTVTYVDRLPAKTVFLELSALQTHIKNLTLDGKKPVPVSLSAKVRSVRTDPGTLVFDGTLMWDPLVAQGTLTTAQFPVQALAPYGMGGLQLDLLRADTSFKGQVRYASLPAGPDVQARGDAAIEELQLNSLIAGAADPVNQDAATQVAPPGSNTATKSTQKTAQSSPQSEALLNWKAMSAPGIEFSMAPGAPMRLLVREISLSDFFARLIINPEGRLVLQDLVRPEDKVNTASAPGTAAPASAPASAPVPAPVHIASPTDPVIDIGPIHLVNGRVAFSDRFIKPHYSADLSELIGSMSHVSSRPGSPLADLELRGRAEGTASLEITGKLNPLAKPMELDVHGKVRDLELSPLSTYAIKYAGYGIERGKLSLDVNYSVAPSGQLQASNKLVLNQLVFGDEVPGAKHLPVKLAVALLADRNGVIDLDLPLSGSLNDPEFRVWPIVWKVVGNILTKALTSPFSLITGLVSGSGAADELGSVAFEAGTARISASALPGLDKIARALVDKSSLRLTVVGTASLEREGDAIKRERLAGQLLAEKRRAAASAAKDVTSVQAVTAEESAALLKEVYRRSGIRKPRNVVGLAKDLTGTEMEALLLQSFSIDEDAVRALALQRGLAVREYLTAHKVPSDRLFMGDTDIDPALADWQPRAELSIEHK